MLNKQVKNEIVEKFRRKTNDTGSSEVQIALLSARIKQLTTHLNTHKKDFHSRRGLFIIIGQRKRLLKYLHKSDINTYHRLSESLGIKI